MVSFLLEKSGLLLEKSGLLLEKSGLLLEKSGLLLEKSGLLLENNGRFFLLAFLGLSGARQAPINNNYSALNGHPSGNTTSECCTFGRSG